MAGAGPRQAHLNCQDVLRHQRLLLPGAGATLACRKRMGGVPDGWAAAPWGRLAAGARLWGERAKTAAAGVAGRAGGFSRPAGWPRTMMRHV